MIRFLEAADDFSQGERLPAFPHFKPIGLYVRFGEGPEDIQKDLPIRGRGEHRNLHATPSFFSISAVWAAWLEGKGL